jgi:hypothetical protein
MPDWEPRFWSKVDVREDDTLCWLWKDAPNSGGYGVFKMGYAQDHAHRIAYVLAYGPIPDGLWVLHRCNVRLCCNPKHLYAGTQVDNMHDRRLKMGGRYGGGQPRKLSPEKEAEIRALYGQGKKQYVLAEMYGVSSATVSRILHDKSRPAEQYRKFIPDEHDPLGDDDGNVTN